MAEEVPETVFKEGGKGGEGGEGGDGGKGGEGENKGEESEPDHYNIDTRNLWAFFAITTMLIIGTVIFEICKHSLMHNVVGTPMQPLVMNLFSELTVLGFLGVVTFLIGQYTLHFLSAIIFGEHGKEKDEENKELLGEMLEHIHMVLASSAMPPRSPITCPIPNLLTCSSCRSFSSSWSSFYWKLVG